MNDPRPPRTEAAAVDRQRVDARVAATIRPDVQSLRAYPVAKADGLIKLDAMENPFALPADLRERLARELAGDAVNRYPDGAGDAVKQALAASLSLPPSVALLLGNGSDEILQLITTAVAVPGACIVAPEPTFVMYRLNAMYANVRYVGVPLREDFSLDEAAMLAAIARERPQLVWLAYPNKPTGNRFAPEANERILSAAPGLVVVDEAYYAFADDSFLPRVLAFDNLVVVRTVSKIGLAGLRLGYAAAHPAWIAQLDKVRPPYNVNALTQTAVPILLAAGDELAQQAATIRSERARLHDALASRADVVAFPTETNFVLIRVRDSTAWFTSLRDAGILVKDLHGYHPSTANCLRITVGTPAENETLLDALARCS